MSAMKNSQKISNSFPRPLRDAPNSGAQSQGRGLLLVVVNFAFVSLLLGVLLYAGLRIVGDSLSLSLSFVDCVALGALYLMWRTVNGALFSQRNRGSVPH